VIYPDHLSIAHAIYSHKGQFLVVLQQNA